MVEAGGDPEAKNKIGQTVLHKAFVHRMPELVGALLDQHASPDLTGDAGETLLHLAAENGDMRMTAYFLVAGYALNATDDKGFTPLHYAAMGGHLDICKGLTQLGAQPSFAPKRPSKEYHTPLQQAAQTGHAAVVRYFIEDCGEDVAQRTPSGRTLLQLAGRHPQVRDLLRALKTALAINGAISATQGQPGALSAADQKDVAAVKASCSKALDPL